MRTGPRRGSLRQRLYDAGSSDLCIDTRWTRPDLYLCDLIPASPPTLPPAFQIDARQRLLHHAKERDLQIAVQPPKVRFDIQFNPGPGAFHDAIHMQADR